MSLTATIFAAVAASATTAPVTMDAPAPGFATFAWFHGSDGVVDDASRWFTMDDAPARWTAWRDRVITFSVTLPADHSAGELYRLGVTAMNANGPLRQGYEAFKLKARVGDAPERNLVITASDTTWHTTWIDLGPINAAPGATVPVRLRWTNDDYKKGVYDANIAYGGVQVAWVGEPIPAPGVAGLALAGGLLGATRRRRA